MKPSKKATLPRLGGALRTLIIAGVLMAQVGLSVAFASVEPDLLEPERAFQLSAQRKDLKTVELRYKIADGYYMYRPRFKFAIVPATSAKLGKAAFSKGKMKLDPTFGRVEIYRESVRILLPIARLGNSAASTDKQSLLIKVTSQGCADAGVCYPPMHQTLTLRPASLDIVVPDDTSNEGRLLEQSQSGSVSAPQSFSDALRKTNKP